MKTPESLSGCADGYRFCAIQQRIAALVTTFDELVNGRMPNVEAIDKEPKSSSQIVALRPKRWVEAVRPTTSTPEPGALEVVI